VPAVRHAGSPEDVVAFPHQYHLTIREDQHEAPTHQEGQRRRSRPNGRSTSPRGHRPAADRPAPESARSASRDNAGPPRRHCQERSSSQGFLRIDPATDPDVMSIQECGTGRVTETITRAWCSPIAAIRVGPPDGRCHGCVAGRRRLDLVADQCKAAAGLTAHLARCATSLPLASSAGLSPPHETAASTAEAVARLHAPRRPK
jgi:hypothetical protein